MLNWIIPVSSSVSSLGNSNCFCMCVSQILEEDHFLVTYAFSDKAVCRTALASQGLLNIHLPLLPRDWNFE